MTRPVVAMPDAQRAVVDILDALINDATVTTGVPSNWLPTSTKHLEVAWDGTPAMAWPVSADATIRLVARAQTSTAAKALCARAQGLAVAYMGGPVVARIDPLTGVLPARDPKTQAELASCTVRVTVRSQPIT